MRFATPAARVMKKYKPKYILVDKAYDSEKLRKCINEELGVEDQISTRGKVKRGFYKKLA